MDISFLIAVLCMVRFMLLAHNGIISKAYVNTVLGAISFNVFCAVYFLDATPNFELSYLLFWMI
jgi:hypothetical protein